MSANGNSVQPYVFEQKGTHAAPFTFPVPGSLEIRPDTATATFDGTGASGDFLACLTFYGTDGERLCRMFNPTPVPKGSIAEVTYIPPFGSAATSAAAGATVETTNTGGTVTVNPTTELLIGANLTLTNPTVGVAEIAASSVAPGSLIDYVPGPSGVFTVTATSAATAQTYITGNAVTLDGATTVEITVWLALADTNRDLVLELFIDGIDQGRIGQLSPGAYSWAGSLTGFGHVKPAAGSHVFIIAAWTDVGATTTIANPTPFPSVSFQPSFYKLVALPIP